jgi:cation diffusion facilitator CzcD-associated flavoprotein CzcO
VEEVPIPLAHLHAQVADPDLRARLTPDYELGCKRVLISNDFYPALQRDNVALVTEGVARITPDGVVDAAGVLHPADVIIYATGFETRSFAGEVRITGLDGLALDVAWVDGPEAHLGVTTPGFPNLFMLYGPNTNLGHNSIIYMIEAQADYVLQALDVAAARGPIAVRPEVSRRYNDDLQAALAATPWAGNCTSWYKTADGRILNNWPHTARAYAEAVASFDPAEFKVVGARAMTPAA